MFDLYKRVAQKPGGLARLANEISPDYVSDFLTKAQADGVSLVAVDDGAVVGEIHACSPGLFIFSHVLSDLTIAVDPAQQGRGTGRLLFESFMARVQNGTDIRRVELISRESNERAIAFYESLGFVKEGRLEARVRNVDETFEADIPMAWTRG